MNNLEATSGDLAPIQDCVQCGAEIREVKAQECGACDARLCWLCHDSGDGECGQCRRRAGKLASRYLEPAAAQEPYQEHCVECNVGVVAREETLCFWCMQPMCAACHAPRHACSRCERHIHGDGYAPVARQPRTEPARGRPKVLRECPDCNGHYGYRDMRSHECVKACSACRMAPAEHADGRCDECFLGDRHAAQPASTSVS